MKDCLFCKIVNKEIDSDIVYEDEDVLAFNDINPQAPVHVLVVPKKHISSIIDINKLDKEERLNLLSAIEKIARQSGLEKDGFRVVTNTGTRAGQSVFHLHFHILGKRKFDWPPG